MLLFFSLPTSTNFAQFLLDFLFAGIPSRLSSCFQNHMNALAAETASAWYLTLKRKLHLDDDLLLLTVTGRSSLEFEVRFRHICHASLTMGTFLISAGAAVITPQRRFIRAPQGSASSPWAGVNKYL